MLQAHMDACERALVATSKVPANAGHTLHKGTPREAFIKEFLESHLAPNVTIGTGELIDSSSKPEQKRNQFDIVIYMQNYPKLDFGGGISAFLIESVIATIEVKSTLTEDDIKQAIGAAKNAKQLTPHVETVFHAGRVPPSVLNYVVAYDGPVSMETVYDWIPKIHSELGIHSPLLPQEAEARFATMAPSIDGVFVLEKGFAYFDNVPLGFANAEARAQFPNLKWIYGNTPTGNLLMLFLFLLNATSNLQGKWLQATAYLSGFKVAGLHYGTA